MDSNQGSLYQPLKPSDRQFRLLRLRESNTNQIQCEMKSFSLIKDNLPPWKALSYRWGEDNPAFTVSLNDHPVSVRKGLQTFLTQMMTEKQQVVSFSVRVLSMAYAVPSYSSWHFIDALCIHQNNDFEKSCQVAQMGEIYRRAEEVMAWIVYEPYHYENDEFRMPRAVYDLDQHVHDISSLSRPDLENAVLENSYWSRLWILQEVLLAKRLTIRIGSAEVKWYNLYSKNTRRMPTIGYNDIEFRQHGIDPPANKRTALDILSHRHIGTKLLRAGNHLPFHLAVTSFSMQRCGRPQDAVFGYLGLTDSRIQIDYSMPILDLFLATLSDYLLSAGLIAQDLARFQFVRHNSTEILWANEIIAPLLAFGLDPRHPVIYLLVFEVTKFFAPGFEKSLTEIAASTGWIVNRLQIHARDFDRFLYGPRPQDAKVETIGLPGVVFINFGGTDTTAWMAVQKEIIASQKELKQNDAMMLAPGESGQSKTYTQWAAHARAISEQILQRCVESGQDREGDLDNEL